jgi:Flp pilus assembly protein TadG
MDFPHKNHRRPGATVPLFAILCVPLVGMLAFSIDVGWIALVRTDLQTAADAAALAGAEQLQNLYVQYTMPGVTQSQVLTVATTNTVLPKIFPYNGGPSPMLAAENAASKNKAGNVQINVRDQDVSFSFYDGTNFYSNYSTKGNPPGFPNTITVTTRRDNTLNSPVSLFFGPIFGWDKKELEATATATIYAQDVNTLQTYNWLQSGQSVGAHILPVALDVNIWNYFYTGNGDSTKVGFSPDGTKHVNDTNGQPQLFIYPNGPWALDPTGNGGSFGLVDVGPPANNVPAFRNWITNGQTTNDINYLLTNSLLPVFMSAPKSWKAGPGLKDTLATNFNQEMWQPNLIPLFIPQSAPSIWQSLTPSPTASTPYQAGTTSGSGNTYSIVGFVGVVISQADGSGSNMNISIQPSAVVDPTAGMPNPKPAGTQWSSFGSSGPTGGPVITTFASAKLTQ